MTEAAHKKPPLADAKIKSEAGYETVGQIWETSKKNVTSVKLDRPLDSFIIVRRDPKPKAPTNG
jgi:hypothetical protein